MPSLQTAFKLLLQIGPRPLTLYALYRLGLKTGHYRRASAHLLNLAGREKSPIHPLFHLPKREAILAILDARSLADLFGEADEITEGKVRLFGSEPAPLQLSFTVPLQHWTAYASGQIPLPACGLQPADFPEIDPKFLWEPARFGWAFVLGRAYHLSGNEKYARAFWQYAEHFIESNPAYLGPHWMNGQEVALRLMAFAWAAQVFAASPASTPNRIARLTQSIVQHALRIPLTLVYARAQDNNHLISEATALYTAGLFLLEQPQAARWRALGWRWLNWAFQHQIGSYGEYIQHSTNYHRLMLHCALWVNTIKQDSWPRATMEALRRASAWIFSLLDPVSGRTPNLGANDGALILPLAVSDFADYRPTVQAAARAFLKSGLTSGPWDEMSLWLGLPAAEQTLEPEAYLADNLHGRQSWAYLRTTTFKSRLGHMDQLHLDLWWRGLNIAQDAGTYSYNAPLPWDNPLVISRVHNTVTVDDREQMTRAGRFMTLDWFPAYTKIILETDERILQRMRAHYKTRRLQHERTVTVYADEHWLVADKVKVTDKAEHTFRLHWLLPDWEWTLANAVTDGGGAAFALRLKSPQGDVTLRLIPDHRLSASACRLTIVRAGEVVYGAGMALPYEGWISLTYGHKTPALSLAFECLARESITFLSEFRFPV
jgi:hypothetical protein